MTDSKREMTAREKPRFSISHLLRVLWIPLLSGLIVFAVVFYGLWSARSAEVRLINEKESSVASTRIRDVAALLTSEMNVRLNLTNSLVAFVKSHEQFDEKEFNVFASFMHQNFAGVRSLQLAPGGIVTYVTEPEQNKAAIGHDLFGDPARRDLALRSVRQKSYIIAGPINLIQGGQAIIARRPIFLPAETIEGEEFWGFATVLIDIDTLFEEVALPQLEADYQVAIRGKDGLGAAGDVFYGDPKVFDLAIATGRVFLPDASWQLAVAPKPGQDSAGIVLSGWYISFSLLIASMLAWVTYNIVDRPRQLEKKVLKATKNLQYEINQRKEAEEQVRYIAQHDMLTELPNRILFNEIGNQLLHSAKREKTLMAVLFIDLDGFKLVNDTHGHQIGDSLLRVVASKLKKLTRDSDLVARIGGDEFVVLLPNKSDKEGAETVARNIITELNHDISIDDHVLTIGASIGIAVFPNNGTNLDTLVQTADTAMYKSKDRGKGCYCFADEL